MSYSYVHKRDGSTIPLETSAAMTIPAKSGDYTVSVTNSNGGLSRTFGPVVVTTTDRSETTAYAARVSSGGGAMTSQGKRLVNRLYGTAAAASLARGYLFGEDVNIPVDNDTSRTLLELTGNGESITADASSNDSTLYSNRGMVGLSGTTTGQGYLKTSSESLFTNSDWTIFLYAQKALETSISSPSSMLLSQYSAFTNGHVYWEFDGTGNIQFYQIGTGGRYLAGTNSGGGFLGPCVGFLTFDYSTKTITPYDPIGQAAGTPLVLTYDIAQLPTYFGNAQRSIAAPQKLGFASVLKFDTILSNSEMDEVWEVVRDESSHDRVLIIGNSVTSGADAGEATGDTSRNWPCKFSQSAVLNNVFTYRVGTNMGGRTVYHFRPEDYTGAEGSAITLPTFISAYSIDNHLKYRPTILLNDDNQNAAAYSSLTADYEIDYGGCLDAIMDEIRNYVTDAKIVTGTQLAVQKGSYTDWADMVADFDSVTNFRKNLRDWSVLTRSDSRYDAYAELYAYFNLGWDAGEDGDAEDPLNDYPNGDPSKFYDDDQHPDGDAHTEMASRYWTAVSSVRRFT